MNNRNVNECALVDHVEIIRDKCSYTVSFTCSETLRRYFKSLSVRFEYPIEISSIPDAVLLVPFVANVAPLIWLTDAKIIVPCLDRDFVECLERVKSGYAKMYLGVSFRGQIDVEKVVDCSVANCRRCGMFYSGGLDSVDTFVRHHLENPDLISVWGADVKYDNESGWRLAHTAVEYAANRFKLPDFQIHSQFREFLDEGVLSKEFRPMLQDSWWYSIQHAMGLLGHVAPLAYVRGYECMYIASSFTDVLIKCASSPLTDNFVRFCGCHVVHDGFECSRQQKVGNVVRYCQENEVSFPLHVCWKSSRGSNCCRCEKCLRTIFGILAEGANPDDFGFAGYDYGFVAAQKIAFIITELYDDRSVGGHAAFWQEIHNRMVGKEYCLNGEVGKFIRWARQTDFSDKDAFRLPWRVRVSRSQALPIRVLRKIKHLVVQR